MIKRFGIVFTLLIFIFTSACSSVNTGETAETIKEQPEEPAVVEEPVKAEEPEMEKEEKVNFIFPKEGIRPIAVMIDNEGVKSLPQGGLDKAQLIYEIIVEGGETRLMPVFWDAELSMVGPVRSSRHYFLDYSIENDAIYVHFGWSPMAMSDISKYRINNINGVANGGEIFYDLTKDRNNWQDSYTSSAKINEYVKKAKYRTTSESKPVFLYNDTDVEMTSGSEAKNIKFTYSAGYTCGFEYNAESKDYKRLRKGKPQMERVTGNQLAAKNIVIQMVGANAIKGDDKGRQTIANVGSGKGWFITDGKVQDIKWSKASRTAQTKYVDKSGEPIKLNPGQTWVQIVPLGGKVEIK